MLSVVIAEAGIVQWTITQPQSCYAGLDINLNGVKAELTLVVTEAVIFGLLRRGKLTTTAQLLDPVRVHAKHNPSTAGKVTGQAEVSALHTVLPCDYVSGFSLVMAMHNISWAFNHATPPPLPIHPPLALDVTPTNGVGFYSSQQDCIDQTA